MESNKKRVADYISEFPNATNSEIANELEINENSVKAYISQLKSGGFIKVTTDDSKRVIETLSTFDKNSAISEKIELKRDVYLKLLDRYIDDLDLTDDINNHLKIGNSILRILDNL